MKATIPSKKRHAMSEFGTVFGTSQNVRANRLESRLKPLVPFPHRHAFYHLIAITSGGGWHEIDFHRYEAGPGQLFLMKPGQVHSWQLGGKTQGFVIEFEGSSLPAKGPDAFLLDRILKRSADHYEFSGVEADRGRRILALLKTMAEEYEEQAPDFEASLRHYLVALLIALSRLERESGRDGLAPDPVLDRFLKLIDEHYQKEHEVEFYARQLAITSKALTMRASRALGRSARSLIQDRVLLEGKRLLAYSDATVAEIAYELGFSDPNYFTRFFRSHAGEAPGVFRSQVRSLC